MQTVADEQVVHAGEHGVQEPELKKYAETHVVYILGSEHAAQFKGQQAPLTNTWVESHVVQTFAEVQAVHPAEQSVHKPLFNLSHMRYKQLLKYMLLNIMCKKQRLRNI